MKKYLLLSGIIRSQHDKQLHYISAQKLQKLFNLPIKECILANNENDLDGVDFTNLLILQPNDFGVYNAIS